VALAAFLVPALLPAAAQAAPAQGVATNPAAARKALDFWTPARMRQARPLEVRPSAPGPRAAAPVPRETTSEAPHRVPAAPPADAPGAVASARPPSVFGEVPDPTAETWRQNGVIFFQVEGSLARCSGTSVDAPNRSVVFTAGHCVNSGGAHGQWYRHSWVFVPGYRYGQRPFGVFAAKWLDATPAWLASGSENGDVAAAVVTVNEGGERLGDAVGGAGIAWGLKANQDFDVHGYPVAPPFDGETQRLCSQRPFLGHDPESFLAPGPLNLAVDCDVTGGASGGGWTIAGNLLNSVTNYGYPEDPATDFGAYFGKDVGRLYKRAGAVR